MTTAASGLEPPEEAQEAAEDLSKKQGVIFVLENASLETAKVGKVRIIPFGYGPFCCLCEVAFLQLHCIGTGPAPTTCGQGHLDLKPVTKLHAHAALFLLSVHLGNRCSGPKIPTQESCHLDQVELAAGLQAIELR